MKRVRIAIKKVPGLIWGSLVVLILFAVFVKNYTAPKNIENILRNTSVLIVVSIGMTMAIISKKIDLSIGGVMTFSGMIAGLYLHSLEGETTALHIIIVLLLGILTGTVFGIFSGLMIGVYKYNYWLVTFATMSMAFGLSQAITNGKIVAGYSTLFRKTLSSGKIILGIPNIIIISLIIVIIMNIILKRTRFGMHIYAVGDSEQCAEHSGISVKKVRFLVYVISGALAGLGGVLLIARTNSAAPVLAVGYEFDAIAAVIVGGTSFDGGKGSLWGTVFGAIIIAAVKSGLQLIGLNIYWQQTFVGLFILSVIVTDVLSARRRKLQGLRRIYKS
jgi:ribose transport system permease protein